MKKVILLCFVAIGFALNASAQDISPNALGLRLGDSDGFGAEISYQRALGSKNNRLELDLGWRSNNNYGAFKLTGLYQWVWNIDGGFNWYAGVGAGVGSWSYDTPGYDGDGTVIFAAGDVGIEYNFDIPLQLSLDIRPEFGSNSYDGFDIALGVRYRF